QRRPRRSAAPPAGRQRRPERHAGAHVHHRLRERRGPRHPASDRGDNQRGGIRRARPPHHRERLHQRREQLLMAIERLPERMQTPAVARAIMSPSGILLAGAGTAAAIIGGLPLAAAAVIGAAVWAGKVALAIPRKPKPERIDLSKLGHPWREY